MRLSARFIPLIVVLACALAFALASARLGVAASQRLPGVEDFATLVEVGEPQISPEGDWVAYTVTRMDEEKDTSVASLWMVSWDGRKSIQLTHDDASVSSPRWSPDGRFLAFMRQPEGDDEVYDQIWLLDRRGGEAQQLTNQRGRIFDYAWSPDGKRLALVMQEEEEQDRPRTGEPPRKDERPRPIVIERYQFKSDEFGYHGSKERPRIFLFELESRSLAALTSVKTFAESWPTWSPDGGRIAFVSNRNEDSERTENDVWVAEARPGVQPVKLTEFEGGDEGPLSWSPDGRHVAYLQGSEPRYWLYNYYQLAVVPAAGGAVRLPTTALDRDISSVRYSADGRHVDFLMTDDRRQYLARLPAPGGDLQRLIGGARVVMQFERAAHRPERLIVLSSTPTSPPAIYALEGAQLRQLTHHNDAWLAVLKLSTPEDVEFAGRDGVAVHGLVTKPADWQPGRRYPTILWIHGGPYEQDEHDFDFLRQLLAANGYVVLQVNYRGSSGRGTAFGRGIFADWGNADLKDLLAGVDHLIAAGIADPQRLGVGGWSQGGILTDFVIAHDQRFKAAISGAGVANQLGVYGHDQYVYLYDMEFGQPWVNPELWIKLSYPFFNAGRITTPTLFLGGDRDFNVPIIGGEQLYQALKSRGIPARLVIYPGERHTISRPSFVRDRLERYIAWYAEYLGT